MAPISRRAFLRALGGGAAIALFPLAACGPDQGGPAPLIAPTAAPANGSLPPLPERLITPTADLYKQYYSSIPEVDRAAWSFLIDGSVGQRLQLTHAEILELPQTSIVTTMECIGNQVGGRQIGNVKWTGTLWREYVSRFGGALPQAVEWRFECADGYITTLPIERLEQGDVLLAHSMNDELLPQDHGAPLRIIIPGKYGQKQPKWLTRMQAIDEPELGFWEQRGWSNTAEILLHSIVRQVQGGSVYRGNAKIEVPLGPIVVAGIALDGARAISRVEVSTDDGATWRDAENNRPETPHEWTLWQYLWEPAATGTYRVTARAYADDGTIQEIADKDASDGKTTNFVVEVTVI